MLEDATWVVAAAAGAWVLAVTVGAAVATVGVAAGFSAALATAGVATGASFLTSAFGASSFLVSEEFVLPVPGRLFAVLFSVFSVTDPSFCVSVFSFCSDFVSAGSFSLIISLITSFVAG